MLNVCFIHDHFQMFRLLSCKVKEDRANMLLDDDVEMDQCPMAESLQEQLREFCAILVENLGSKSDEDQNSNSKRAAITGELEEEGSSWVDSLAHLVVSGRYFIIYLLLYIHISSVPPPPVVDDQSIYKKGTENFKKMIINTLKRWANESEIESNELVRGIFHLLLRQYAGVKGIFLQPA